MRHAHTHTLTPTYIHSLYTRVYVHINIYLASSPTESGTSGSSVQPLRRLGDPRVHPHALPRGAGAVLRVWGPAQHHRSVEVAPGVLPVTAIVGAARAAQTVHGGAPHVLPGLQGLRLRLEARRGHSIPGR